MRKTAWVALFSIGLWSCMAKAPSQGTTGSLSPPDAGGSTGFPQPIGSTLDGGSVPPQAQSSNTDAGVPPRFADVDWPQYRLDPRGQSALTAGLSLADAPNVRVAWTAQLGPYLVAQPAIVGDTVFVTGAFSGTVFALDAATGQTKWSTTLNYVIPNPCDSTRPAHTGIWAAPGVYNGKVYVASPDGIVYALDAGNGSIVWKTQVAHVDRHEQFVESSPAIASELHRLYVGVASTFGCDPASGQIAALDLDTGALTIQQLPAPGQPGSTIWSSISVDPAAGRVYATTGDSANVALDQAPLSQAFVAFDAQTLAPVDHWQNGGPTPAQDSDFGASPTLFETNDGSRRIAAPNKDGWLYVLDREHLSAGPVWKFQLADSGDPSAGHGSISSPAFAKGTLYAAGGQTPQGEVGSLVAFGPATGVVRWKHVPAGYVLAAPIVVGDVIALEATTPDNSKSSLKLIDASTGNLLASFAGSTGTFGAPAAGRGLIVWVQRDGTVTALKVSP